MFNDADFYDLFGPTKTGRKGYGVSVGRKWTLLYDDPRRLEFDVEGAYSVISTGCPSTRTCPWT